MENQILNKKNSTTEVPSAGIRRISWGTGIVIAFGLFITFILYFVFTVQ